MSTVKTVGVLCIIVGCFAILYPRFMHPIALRVLGLHKPQEKEETPFNPPHKMVQDPRMRGGNMHMRPGPHPGLRAAAEMERERAQQGSGRGMMGIVLPMYAVGIVLYLVYTLVKVFNKKNGGAEERNKDALSEYLQGNQPSSLFDEAPTNLNSQASMEEFLKKQKSNELEKLLMKADDKNITSEEMRALQKRLEETEAQMTSILRAMQAVSSKVDNVASNNPDLQDMLASQKNEEQKNDTTTTGQSSTNGKSTADGQSTTNGQSTSNGEGTNETEKSSKSNNSTPDLESFEIVKKGSNSEGSNNTDDDLSQSLLSEVENIGAGDLPESESKMKESESTESCSEVKDTESDLPEGTTEVIPDATIQEDSTVRHRKQNASDD